MLPEIKNRPTYKMAAILMTGGLKFPIYAYNSKNIGLIGKNYRTKNILRKIYNIFDPLPRVKNIDVCEIVAREVARTTNFYVFACA